MPFPEDPIEELSIPETTSSAVARLYIGAKAGLAKFLNMVGAITFFTGDPNKQEIVVGVGNSLLDSPDSVRFRISSAYNSQYASPPVRFYHDHHTIALTPTTSLLRVGDSGEAGGTVTVFNDYSDSNKSKLSITSSNPINLGPAATNGIPVLTGQRGVALVSSAGAVTTILQDVNFPVPFNTGGIPVVFLDIQSAAGNTGQWHVRAYNITETGFRIFAFAGNGVAQTWSNVQIGWLAVGERFLPVGVG